jgi:phasin family protein
MQTMLKNIEAVSKTAQSAGIEWADFAKQSLQHSSAAMQKLAKARDPKTAMEIQAEYLKGSYQRMAAQAKLIGELYTGLAKDMSKDLGKGAPADVKLPAIV